MSHESLPLGDACLITGKWNYISLKCALNPGNGGYKWEYRWNKMGMNR